VKFTEGNSVAYFTGPSNPMNSPLKAVLFKSKERFPAFQKKLSEYGVDITILDFDNHDWLDFDYSNIDFLIYYPSFEYSMPCKGFMTTLHFFMIDTLI